MKRVCYVLIALLGLAGFGLAGFGRAGPEINGFGLAGPGPGRAGATGVGAVCGLRGDVARRLRRRFGETPAAVGIVGDNLLELYTSKRGSFTLVLTRAGGVSCLLAAGKNWHSLKPPKDTPKDTSEKTPA